MRAIVYLPFASLLDERTSALRIFDGPLEQARDVAERTNGRVAFQRIDGIWELLTDRRRAEITKRTANERLIAVLRGGLR